MLEILMIKMSYQPGTELNKTEIIDYDQSTEKISARA